MSRSQTFLRMVSFLLVAIAVLGIGLASSSADYVLTQLDTSTEFAFQIVNAINDSGQVVGSASPYAPRSFPVAVLWQNGRLMFLGGGTGNSALDINNAGQVVGGAPAYLWDKGRVTLLGPGGVGTAINSSGQIVGTGGGPDTHAVVWQNGSMTDLGPGFANAINAAGQIVGASGRGGYDRRKLVPYTASDAMLWQNGTATDLGPGYANAINASGQIVGSSNSHAVLWQGGTRIDLGPGVAEAINNQGFVVGTTGTDPGTGHAFLWHNGMLTDLNDLIPADSGWTLSEASAINNLGQIVGYGNRGLFLLTPVPEPISWVLLGLGTLAVIAWARCPTGKAVP